MIIIFRSGQSGLIEMTYVQKLSLLLSEELHYRLNCAYLDFNRFSSCLALSNKSH